MKKNKIIVLGGGLVGGAIARDLCFEYEVTVVDNNSDRIENLKNTIPVRTNLFDIKSHSTLKSLLDEFDLVINAVPGYMGFGTLRKVISAGKNVVDISFFDRDPFELDYLAKDYNVSAIVDCGIAPGFSNLLLGYHSSEMKVDGFKCYVGGLPYERVWPFEYKAAFSPTDVIEEYRRPARFVINGNLIVKEALSDSELIYFEDIGTLEAFNSDGLRTLLTTVDVPNMIEKTLRYPGHIDLIKIFRGTGFLSDEPIKIDEQTIKPIDVTSELLFRQWKLNELDEEFTVMKVIVEGKKNGIDKQYIYDVYDRYDIHTRTSSMARTTGFTCTTIARLFLQKDILLKGIIPPEYIGSIPGVKERVVAMLQQKGIRIKILEN